MQYTVIGVVRPVFRATMDIACHTANSYMFVGALVKPVRVRAGFSLVYVHVDVNRVSTTTEYIPHFTYTGFLTRN